VSILSFSCKFPNFFVLRTRITVLDLQSAKILSRFLHPLISPKILSMHRNNISFFISIKFIQINSFLNIPKFMLSKQKLSLILPLIKAQRFTSFKILPLFFRSGFFLSTELHKSSRILCTTTTDLCTELLFSLLQFPTITVSGPDNGTICWHRGRPRVQCFNNAPTKP
jgi:hypothetical protein